MLLLLYLAAVCVELFNVCVRSFKLSLVYPALAIFGDYAHTEEIGKPRAFAKNRSFFSYVAYCCSLPLLGQYIYGKGGHLFPTSIPLSLPNLEENRKV